MAETLPPLAPPVLGGTVGNIAKDIGLGGAALVTGGASVALDGAAGAADEGAAAASDEGAAAEDETAAGSKTEDDDKTTKDNDNQSSSNTPSNSLSKAADAAGLAGILSALWSPLRIVELIIGLVLLFMGIHTLTGISATPALKAAAAAA